jgi:glycosyltransferase involved in cell wall biosynthesis
MRILSGIDVHFAPNCGSILIAQDLYSNLTSDGEVRFLVLNPLSDLPLPPIWRGLPVRKAQSTGDGDGYQAALNGLVDQHIDEFAPELLHCQHLGYGMTKAFIRHRSIPKLGVCHGTDVLEAVRDSSSRSEFREIITRLDRIVFPSRGILADAREVTEIPDDKVALVPWGLPEPYLAEERPVAEFEDRPFSVLYAGRFDESKGIDILLDALRWTSDNLRLTLIGAGALSRDILRWIAQAGLGGRVEIRPWMERGALQEEFGRHQLLVLPSRKIEAFGLVCVEAQAAALPVIVSRVSGLPEIVPAGCDVLSFESGDARALAGKMAAIAGDSNLWRDLSRRCRAHARRFSISACVQHFTDESRRLIHG